MSIETTRGGAIANNCAHLLCGEVAHQVDTGMEAGRVKETVSMSDGDSLADDPLDAVEGIVAQLQELLVVQVKK